MFSGTTTTARRLVAITAPEHGQAISWATVPIAISILRVYTGTRTVTLAMDNPARIGSQAM